VSELKSSGKSFDISKWEVWEAYEKVKANKGAPGVDGCSLEKFEEDLKNNLYRIWNRMSSGSYFPPPVLAVEIPKPNGGGTRVLGVPTVADRIAQTVVARRLEAKVEPVGFQNSGTGAGLRLYAARSYSLISPPRTARRLSARWWSRSGGGMIGEWRAKPQRSMWPAAVVVGAVPGKDGPQVALAEDQDAVSELGSGGQDEAFGEAVRSGISR
jgi:hypothetical protein